MAFIPTLRLTCCARRIAETVAERAQRRWAAFLQRLRRIRRLSRIWAYLGHHLRDIRARGRLP